MQADYPLTFRPLLREYIWGGRRLGTELNKPIGAGDRYAESWEVVDRGDDQSVVEAGPLAGWTLARLLADHNRAVLGRHAGLTSFPLLLKYLDCHRVLSVQVHPDDDEARRMDPPDLGKTEAWYILHAEPESVLYAGLRPGVGRDQFAEAIRAGRAETCLHHFAPRAGDCVFIPAGTVHALGAGLLVAEIQQSSDTTFRLFDWNRVDADGRPRPLHIEQGLEVIDYRRGPVDPRRAAATVPAGRERLVACEKFVLDRLGGAAPASVGGDDRCHLLTAVEDGFRLHAPPGFGSVLPRGQTTLVPAACGAVQLEPLGPTASALDIYLP